MSTTPQTVRVSADDQSMWQSGDAFTLNWAEYVPIIGGDITLYQIENAKLTSGTGKVTVDDGRIKYDPEGTYDDLAVGATDSLTISYDVVDADANRITKTTEITVTGGASEAVFTHDDSGYEGTGKLAFGAVTAAELLQDVHNFEKTTPIDIDFDAAESLADGVTAAKASLQEEVDRNQANLDQANAELAVLQGNLTQATTKAGLIKAVTDAEVEIAARFVVLEGAEAAAGVVNGLFNVLEDARLEQAAASIAETGANAAFSVADGGVQAAQGGVTLASQGVTAASESLELLKTAADTAQEVVDGLEVALNSAKNLLAGALETIENVGAALGDFIGDAAYQAQLLALQTADLLPLVDLETEITILVRDKSLYDLAQITRANSQSNVNSLSRQLENEKVDLSAANDAFDNAKDLLDDAQAELRTAQRELEGANATLEQARGDLGEAQNASAAAIRKVGDAAEAYRREGGDTARAALQEAENAAADAYFDALFAKEEALFELREAGYFLTSEPTLIDLTAAGLEVTGAAVLIADKELEIFGTEGYDAVLKASQSAFNTVTDSNIKADVEVNVSSYMQAGLLIDFALDGGSVNSDIDYALTSNAAYDITTDTFTIAPTVTNGTTGESVAFDTASPSMTFFAGLAYNAGATFEILADVTARLLGLDIIDFPDGDTAETITEIVQLDGIIPLIDFDSADAGLEFSPPGFLGDIISFAFNFPTITTEGKAADFDAGFYEDVTGTSLDQIAKVILDLIDLRLEYSDEFQKILADNGASTELFGDDLATTITNALQGVLESLDDTYDEDGDGYVPILVVKQESDESLFHINAIGDDLSGLDDPNKGKFGFYIASGKSDNVFEVSLDVDQLIATVINVALGNTPESTINPLDLSLSIYDLFEGDSDVPNEDIEALKKYLNIDFGFELADLDVRTGVGFRQDFALSVDDINYRVAFEDGTIRDFTANGAGGLTFENASELVDTNNNGEIDYTLSLTPDAEFYNDTEVALNVGYTLDLVKAQLELAAKLPFVELGFETAFSLGPLLRLDGELDLLSLDVFEDRFAFDAGTGQIAGSFVPDTNEAPVAGNDAITIDEDSTGMLDVLANDTDADDDPLSITSVGAAANGTAVLSEDGTGINYTPNTGYSGTDRFTYTVSDGQGGITTAQAIVTVNPVFDDTKPGSGTDDVLMGDAGSNILTGDAGNDVLIGPNDRDKLDGGSDDDTLLGDALPVSATPEVAAQVYRLYQATLNREADKDGHQQWTTNLFTGQSTLEEVANGFVASKEFTNIYGTLSDEAFVNQLYLNVLEREGDAGGITTWTDLLAEGVSRASVAIGFSDSREFVRKAAADAAEFTQENSQELWVDDVFRLYQATLGRLPDIAGLSDWSARLSSGMEYLEVAAGFVGSKEFTNTYGSLDDNGAFVDLLYQNVLNRAADADGRAGWLDAIEGGATRTDIVRGFAQSTEFRNSTDADLNAWMRENAASDELTGGAGNDIQVGGFGSDTFVFNASDIGRDTVLDLEAWDVIDISGFAFDSFAAAKAAFTQEGADVLFSSGGVEALFKSTALAEINNDLLVI